MTRKAALDFSGFERSDVKYRLFPGSPIILSEYVSIMKVHVHVINRTARIALFDLVIAVGRPSS